MWAITCKQCGEANDTGLWIETPAGQKRPKEHYQCPVCGIAFLRKSGPPTVETWDGEPVVIPGDITLESIPPVDKYDNNIRPKRSRL